MNKVDIKTEDMVLLKEKGMSDEKIAQYFIKKGKKISRSAVSYRLRNYYNKKNEDRPRNAFERKTIDISNEELIKLKNKGMTHKEISNYFMKQGKSISVSCVGKRLRNYYETIGESEKIKKRTKKSDSKNIKDEELFKLKEQGKSNREIAEYFKKQGKNVSYTTVGERLNRYYKKIGKEIPEIIRGERKRRNIFIPTKDLVKYREKGMSYRRIAEIHTKAGKPISKVAVRNRLNRYYSLQGKEEPEIKIYNKNLHNRKIDNLLKEILMKGITIKEYYLTNSEEILEIDIQERLKKLKFIVEHAKRQGDQLVADEDFLEVIKFLENEHNVYPHNRYIPYIKGYTSGGRCENGNIDLIKANVFHNNRDLMTFILSKFKLIYGEEYDRTIWNRQKQEYEQKIDKYFSRLHAVEKNARNQAKNKKRNDNSNVKKESNLSDSEEQR